MIKVEVRVHAVRGGFTIGGFTIGGFTIGGFITEGVSPSYDSP